VKLELISAKFPTIDFHWKKKKEKEKERGEVLTSG